MKLIKSLALAILLSAPAAMQAMDFPWITFTLSDQSELSVDAEGLEMTYSDGSLRLHSSRVDKTLPLQASYLCVSPPPIPVWTRLRIHLHWKLNISLSPENQQAYLNQPMKRVTPYPQAYI